VNPNNKNLQQERDKLERDNIKITQEIQQIGVPAAAAAPSAVAKRDQNGSRDLRAATAALRKMGPRRQRPVTAEKELSGVSEFQKIIGGATKYPAKKYRFASRKHSKRCKTTSHKKACRRKSHKHRRITRKR
jgi:hypothetical protein